jgi:hypothetical protein
MSKEIAPLIIAMLALFIVFRRSGKARKVKLVRMWISPTIAAFVTMGTLFSEPFPGWLVLTGYFAAAAAGTELGLLRAHHADLSVDPKTGKVSIQATAIGSALTASFLAIRFGSKYLFPQLREHSHAGANVNHVADGLLVLTVAMLIAQAAFIRRKAKRVLAAQLAAKAIPAAPPTALEPLPQTVPGEPPVA